MVVAVRQLRRPAADRAAGAPDVPPAFIHSLSRRLLAVLLAVSALAYAFLVGWLLASGRIIAMTRIPMQPAAVPLFLVFVFLATVPLTLGVVHSWLITKDLDARARALRAARDAAGERARLKAEALATMGHEIRTPLNAILGFSQLLDRTPLDASQADLVSSLRESGSHLLAVVNNILDHSQLEAGALELAEEGFEVDGLVQACLKAVSLEAGRKGVQLAFRCDQGLPRSLAGDATRLRQVLLNLLSNAVKFTPQGTVTVTAWAAGEGEALRVNFEVRDTGPGIPAGLQGRLFQPFSQLEAGGSRHPGTGLGLAISRNLCRLMGGDLTAQSEPGQGSAFTASVLLRTAPAPAVQAPALPQLLGAAWDGSPASLAVLLVEDNALNRKLSLKVLEGLGCRPDLACDGAEAVQKALRHPYDVILMDVHMPVLDGLQATQALRSRLPPGRRPLVIGLTADDLPSQRRLCLQAGMDLHLPKPLEEVRLAALLRIAAPLAHPRKAEPAPGADAAPAAASRKPQAARPSTSWQRIEAAVVARQDGLGSTPG